MRADIICHHEDWQEQPLRNFLASHAMKLGTPLPPAITEIEGEVLARVNQGRWIADCVVEGCGGAIVVSEVTPLFYCPYCGNADNNGKWYRVIFPAQKQAIEAILLKRPARDGFRAVHRNWEYGESLSKLRAENAERGIR